MLSTMYSGWSINTEYTNKILLILITPILFIPGKRFFKIFWMNLKHFSFEMNSFVAIGTGTDVAIESYDITLIKGDLLNVLSAVKISKGTIRTIKQNLFCAFIYNII